MSRFAAVLLVIVAVAGCAGPAMEPANNSTARNVILFVGDGMGVSTVTAARIFAGQQQGVSGESHVLSFERFPHLGLVKTYNVDAQTSDSAGTMTAIMTGVKTDAGVIGLDEDVRRGDCASAAGNDLVNALELAEIAGMATGIVSTARLTHATPAATYARSADRNWEDDSDLPVEARQAGCADIASQFVAFRSALERRYPGVQIDGIDVAYGGGRQHFLPQHPQGGGTRWNSGQRTDDRDLVREWRERYPDGAYVADAAGLAALPVDQLPVLGLFAPSHLRYAADQQRDARGEPSLTSLTEDAIRRLAQDPDGFFLMVEAGRIDHAHHANNAYGALADTREFARAVEAAVRMTDAGETLILVTADHSHTLTIAGYPRFGNPILGKVVSVGERPVPAYDGLPYTTLGYANGRGFADLGDSTDADARYALPPHIGRADLTDVDTTAPGFHQEATVPLSAETHAGEDVAVYASGPGAYRVRGVLEQQVLFHIMNAAAELEVRAQRRWSPPIATGQ